MRRAVWISWLYQGWRGLHLRTDTLTGACLSRCAIVFGGVLSRDGLGLGRIGAPGYRAHRSVAMAPMFKGIRFGRHHFCSAV